MYSLMNTWLPDYAVYLVPHHRPIHQFEISKDIEL
jgi:hypothetical protein